MGLLSLFSVGKTYGTGESAMPVLRDVSLEVERSTLCAITGASGSGKSTLLNILGLLDRADTGRFVFDGIDIARASAGTLAALRNRRIGFVFQSFHLLARMTALENVTLPFLYRGMAPQSCRKQAMDALERVGMADRAHHRPDQLSGGQRQRVAMARAIVGRPPLILADEPTGNLDSEAAARVMDLLLDLNRGTGTTIVIVTHDPAVAALCPRQITVRDGRVTDDDARS